MLKKSWLLLMVIILLGIRFVAVTLVLKTEMGFVSPLIVQLFAVAFCSCVFN